MNATQLRLNSQAIAGHRRLPRETRLEISAGLYFGSLFLINNPFVAVDPNVKFALFAAMQLCATLSLFGTGFVKFSNLRLIHWIFVGFYTIAIIRTNQIVGEYPARSILFFLLSGSLTVFTFVNACLIAGAYSLHLMRKWTVIALLPAVVMISANMPEITNYSQKSIYSIGDFSYDTYLVSAFALGVSGVCALGQIRFDRIFTISNIFYAAVICTCGYALLFGLARGEALAFFFAIPLYFFPRISIIATPFLMVIIKFIVELVNTPLTARLNNLLLGNFGFRDVLFEHSSSMVFGDVRIFLIGGGMNAFQNHFGFAAGLYPHNVVLEAATVGGVGFAAVLAIIYLGPLMRMAIVSVLRTTSWAERFSLILMMFLMASYLKSGSLMQMWSLCMFTSVFLAAGGTHPRSSPRGNLRSSAS